jgi:hypothetical protein
MDRYYTIYNYVNFSNIEYRISLEILQKSNIGRSDLGLSPISECGADSGVSAQPCFNTKVIF